MKCCREPIHSNRARHAPGIRRAQVDDDGNGTFDRQLRYVYDGEDVVLVYDETGSLENRYLHGPEVDQIFADENALGEVLWGLSDHQGTVRDVVDANGPRNHVKYDSFGNITSESNPSVDFLYAYTGREWDADVGLYYYRARWYDPAVGRFLTEDPIGFAAGDANLYRYVGNSPVNYVDPWGLDWVWPLSSQASWDIGDTLNLWTGGAAGAPSGGDWLDRNFGNSDYGGPDLSGKIIHGAGEAASFAPIAGEIADGKQVLTGRDLQGRPLSPWEQACTGAGFFIPFVPGSVARRVGGTVMDGIRKVSDSAGDAIQRFWRRKGSDVAGEAAGQGAKAPITGARNVNAAAALRKKLSALEDAQKTAARTRTLSDGRIRYYEAEKRARKPGPTRGASFVTEWDQKTGSVRQWMESYDHAGSVVRVHPKTLNGQDLVSPHFPPTGKELGQ